MDLLVSKKLKIKGVYFEKDKFNTGIDELNKNFSEINRNLNDI